MDDKAWQLLMQELKDIKKDIRDFKQEMKEDVGGVKKEMTTLKIKVGVIMATFGYAGTYIKTKFFS